MLVEVSLAESLLNAIAHDRIWRVQFSRKHGSDPGDERRTFDDLNKVIADNIDGAKRAAREQGFREYNEKLQEKHAEIYRLRELVREGIAINDEEQAARPREHGRELPESYLDIVAALSVRKAKWLEKARAVVGENT